mgnify:CR=1 FL=1
MIKFNIEITYIIIKKLGYETKVVLNISNRPELGDYQYNGCMKLAGINHEKPIDIANKI